MPIEEKTLVPFLNLQLTKSSRRENGGAYSEDVFGGKWMVSKAKMIQFTCSVWWYGRFLMIIVELRWWWKWW